MVWMPVHAGTFLDYLDDTSERLAVLFEVTMFCGFRRDEVLGLTWAEVDLDEGVAYVRETASGDGPKSEAGIRMVPLPALVVELLKEWRKRQAADKLAWGPDWADTGGRVFTRQDGTAVPAQWTSTRFETLAYRAGLPAVRHPARTVRAHGAHGQAVHFPAEAVRSEHSRHVYLHGRRIRGLSRTRPTGRAAHC
jgi:integrase